MLSIFARRCDCKRGFEKVDSRSCKDTDECNNNPDLCGNGNCINLLGGYKCECDAGFNPDKNCDDIDECASRNACSSGFSCHNTQGSYVCSDIDECESNPNRCGNDGTCVNLDGSFKCNCDSGFTMETYSKDSKICVDQDECSIGRHQCDENSKCYNEHGGYRQRLIKIKRRKTFTKTGVSPGLGYINLPSKM